MILTRISPLSAAKIGGALGVILGLIFGLFFALLAAVGGAAGPGANVPGIVGGGLFAVVSFPLFAGVSYAISGALGAVLFNLVAALAGGLELTLEPTADRADYTRLE